jgi:hemerythrin-like domain-containing protein
MYGIDLLVEEHKNIISFTEYLKMICCDILDGKAIDTEALKECVGFGRNYADKHHHAKEEKILFKYMLEHLGSVAEKLIRNGMLVEHDLGRFHMGELENAIEQYEKVPTTENKLAIITNASGYADLLKRHIEKEDAVCYSFALRILSDDDKSFIDEETKQFEREEDKLGIQEKYISWLNLILR